MAESKEFNAVTPKMEARLTLDQTLYAALRKDLEEKRHTDTVLSFYDEGAAREDSYTTYAN